MHGSIDMNNNIENKALRWYGIMTLFIIMAISFIDRINIAVLITDNNFLQHFGMQANDRAAQGFLATAFMLGYGISAFIFTPFCEALFGVRRSFIYGLIIWGIITFISPIMNNYGFLLFSRLLLGLSEGPVAALAITYIKAHFAGHENGKPNSFMNMGTGFGLAIGYPLVAYIILAFSWQTSFYILGIINICLGVPLVLAFIHMPEFSKKNQSINFIDAFVSVPNRIKQGLKTKHVILVMIMLSCSLGYFFGSASWLPTYLREARGFSTQEMGLLSSLPQWAVIVSVFTGGYIIDRIKREQVPLIFIFSSMGVALFITISIFIESRVAAIFCIVLANFCWGIMSPAFPSTVQYYSRPENTASAYGVINGTAALFSAFIPVLMGIIIENVTQISGSTIGFMSGFCVLVAAQLGVLIGGIILWWKVNHYPMYEEVRIIHSESLTTD